MAYDYQGAIKAGANPNDVVNYLSKATGYNAQGAIKAGANPTDVMAYMAKLPSKTEQAPAQNIGQRLATDTNAHAANIVQDLSSKPSFTGALDVAGNVAGEVGDFFGEGLKSITPQPVKDALSGAAKTVAGTPAAQKVLNAWNEFQAQHPDAAKNIGNAVNISALFGGGAVESVAKPAIEAGATAGKEAIVKGAGSAADLASTAIKAPITAAKDLATPIEQNVKTLLTHPIPTTEPTLKTLFTTAKSAVSETGAPTPFDVVGKGQFSKALQSIGTKLDDTGKTLASTLKNSGGNVVDTTPVMSEFQAGLPSRLGTKVAEDGSFTDAPGRISLITGNRADSNIVSAVNDTLKTLGDKPTLQQVHDAVDKLQMQLYKTKVVGAEPINTNTQAFVKSIVGKLNSAAKVVGGTDYAAANSDYARLKNIQFELSNRVGKNFKNAGSMIKRIFSPQDGGTKTLVTQLEKETSLPIFHDATLAKFAMDSVGDPRAASLLKTTMDAHSKGFTKTVLDYVTKKLEDPQGKAIRLIKKSQKN